MAQRDGGQRYWLGVALAVDIKWVNRYLIAAIVILSVIPLLASYILLDEVLEGATGYALRGETHELLTHYSHDLKTLRSFDASNEGDYKARFTRVRNELEIYQNPKFLQQVIHDTYLTYYLIIFVIVLLMVLVSASLISRKVSTSYKRLVERDIKKAEKIQLLNHFDEWQVLTNKLAHEINNPLTPIEIRVNKLQDRYLLDGTEEFKENLSTTCAVVSEEVAKLKEMVRHFSQFSRLPEPVLKQHSFRLCCVNFVRLYHESWPTAKLIFEEDKGAQDISVALDYLLFNQCLINLIQNAVQANPEKEIINVTLSLQAIDSGVFLIVENEGKMIEDSERETIFRMYYSGQKGSDNMGMGLSIVKKIVLDHGGDIECIISAKGAAFKIFFPRI